ncbi:MAG: ATP-binding protein [Leptospiraceae bacterium]|nr:ATP-binding protein [Leptospiraceae bacterium]
MEDAWSQTKKELQNSASDSNVRSCLQSLRPTAVSSKDSGRHFVFELDSAELLNTALEHLKGPIQSRLASIVAAPVSVEFRMAVTARTRDNAWIRPQLSLDRFCEGKANRIALMAARNIAQKPGQVNPLFVYGETGTGKTHLINAIAHQVQANRDRARCVLIRIDEFRSHFATSLQKGKNLSLKNRYRRGDLLFIEDLHAIRGSSANIADELYFIFNSYYESGKQIVVTSDVPIKDLPIASRWLSRFLSGLQVKLELPDDSMRKAILKQKLLDTGISLNEKSVGILQRVKGTARDIESAVNRLYFLQTGGMELTTDLVQQQLEEFLSPTQHGPMDPAGILETVARVCNVSRDELLGNSRKMEIALPRHLAMYLAVHYSELNKSAVARFFRRTDHSTVIHAERKIAMKLEREPSFQHLFRQVCDELGINRG